MSGGAAPLARRPRDTMMQRWFAALLLVAWAAFAWAADTRGPDGLLAVPPLARVTDTTGTLSGADKLALENKLAAFETAHGTQIVVLLVASTQPEPIADFANRVGDAWKIGRAKEGDGLIVAVAKDDRKVTIAVARALEGAVPDLAAKKIIREQIAPRFKTNDFAGGLNAAVDALTKLVEGEGLPAPVGVPKAKIDAGEDVIGVVLPFIIVGVMVGLLLRRMLGVPGALFAGAGSGALSGFMLSSLTFGAIAGLAVFFISLFSGGGANFGRTLGGRRGGGGFTPGGWGGGNWGGGGGGDGGGGWGGGGGSSGGGFSSGGGGDFSGGGASGDW